MRRSRGIIAAILAGAALVAGCAHKIFPEPAGYSVSGFWKDQKARRSLLRQAAAKLSLSYRDPKQGFSGKGQALWSLPQRGRLEVRDPFGRLQYVLVASPKGFSAFYPGDGTWFRDEAAGRDYFRHFIGVDQTFGEMTGWLLGILPDSAGESLDAWAWLPRQGVYEGKLRAGGWSITMGVDPQNDSLRWARAERDGAGFFVEYGSFSPCCGGGGVNVRTETTPLARSVRIESLKTGQAIESEWQELSPVKKTPEGERFEFKPPAGAKPTPLPKAS